jgi:hypothetical protein
MFLSGVRGGSPALHSLPLQLDTKPVYDFKGSSITTSGIQK